MKLWQRIKARDRGKIYISWRYKAPSRFFTKILTWLLGAFVFGIFTSITVHAAGFTEYSLYTARIAFFLVFILGIIDAFFRNIINGNEYQITELGLVNSKPYCGFDRLAEKLEATGIPFFIKSEFIPWQAIKEIKETKDGIVFLLTDSDESLIEEIKGLVSVKNYNEDGVPTIRKSKVSPKSFYGRDDQFDKEVKKVIVQKARLALEGQR